MSPETTLRTTYPCCGGAARFVVVAVPRERYERTCQSCRQSWTIERTQVRLSALKLGIERVDRLDWE